MKDDQSLPKEADEYGRHVSPYFNIEDKAEKYQADKLFKRLRRKVGHAIGDYGMIEEGDKILVALSGGKDSYALLDFLLSLKRSAPVRFDLLPVHIDGGFPNADESPLEEHLKRVGLPYIFEKVPVYDLCKEKLPEGKPFCPLCSRLRRGNLYRIAREQHCNKVALGHHKDDVLATFFLNLFNAGIIKTMPPVMRNDEGDVVVIRPLVYCRERDIKKLSELRQYPVLPKGLCGWGEDQQRAAMGKMLREWDKHYPKRCDIAFRAMKSVIPSHLYDKELFDFEAITKGPKVK